MDSKGKLKIEKMAKREANFDSDDDGLDHLVGGGCAAEEDDGGAKKKRLSSAAGLAKKGSGGSGGGKGCQVEKCVADLSDAKQYHRRHKVCEQHAKAQVVLVSGIRQRFCQQCSRFHEVGEFDDTKRSCRRRLAGHNERRRKNLGEAQLGVGDQGSSRKGATTSSTEVQDMICGPVDDHRRRIKLSIQETGGYKHCHIR